MKHIVVTLIAVLSTACGQGFKLGDKLMASSAPSTPGEAALIPPPASASAPTPTGPIYYVATDGSDSHSCTEALSPLTPKNSIASGLACVHAGDTLYIRSGTYYEGINSNIQTIPTGTSWADAPLISAYPGETVTLVGHPGNGLNLSAPYIQYIIFNGLILDGNGISILGSGLPISGVHHIRIQNTEVKNVLGQGIFGEYGASYIELINLKIHHNGQPEASIENGGGNGGRFDHGIYMSIPHLLIEKCDIYENTGYGIQIYDGGGSISDNTVIRNNRIHDNHGDGNVTLNHGNNIQFYNNIVYNALNGVEVSYRVTNTKVYNNTIYNHPIGSGIQLGETSSGAIVKNNILYQNAGSINVGQSTNPTFSNNLCGNPGFGCDFVGDPRFVDAMGYDFHLLPGSPAIDRGSDLFSAGVTTDFDGVLRPPGAYNIGAYE